MEYNRIMAVTGLPGLFELLSSKADGAIVRSLEDKSTKFVSSRVHNFSHLESIEVYTVRENVNLVDVFTAMQSIGGALPSEKDANAIKAYFQKVYPDMDFERVYSSDMKKMIKWYSILKDNNIEIKLSEAPAEEAEEVEEPVKEEKKAKAKAEPAEADATEEKPKKAAKPKKSADAEGEGAEEKPAKKAAAKKTAAKDDAEGGEEKPKKAARKKKTEE
ncbi:DUF5606 family protein [Pinibacter aurantiacus]|uniref:DUF5606 domain-containing protein n=1 Tax=Pinibacter aurantiacus TaxID=2851599 RepID=A0A9E2SA87_9BACT|nr:DUF5606 domain-containing protein [Pinibacter aurantiacus]MBV4357748.1 DUF5606 domain-containing protein [Pinibacter aurantiacus]